QGGVRLWDVSTGKEFRHFRSAQPISQVEFLGKGLLMGVESCWGGRLHIWETTTGEERHQFEPARWSDVPHQDGTLLSLWETDMARVFVGELRPNRSLGGVNYSAHALSPCGRYV